jgi:L-alanine-DL-glutamate epimerase-like enolase superfamily enzyme
VKSGRRPRFQREVEVVQAVRKLVGKDVKLMVDANDGFDLDSTCRWLDAVGDDLYWIEDRSGRQRQQPFP